MLYFVAKGVRAITWYVGSGLPRLASVESIYADGHELEYLQRLGYGVGHASNVTLHGERANAALRAMRLDAAMNLFPPKPADPSPNGREMVGEAKLPEWHYNKLIKFWDLSTPEQMVYTAAYGSRWQANTDYYTEGALQVARNALYSFWRRHGNPRFKFPADKAFRFADDDWGR